MSGTILENLSGRKLAILVSCLLICQIICFLVGGLIAPVPASHQNIIGMICEDKPGSHNNTNIWLYSRGEGKCNAISQQDIERHDMKMANQIVFVFQMPIPRGLVLDFSRWQQNLIGVLHVALAYDHNELIMPHTELTIDARLAYRNKYDGDNEWKLLAASLEKRNLDCITLHVSNDENLYSCETIPLFELGSLHHDYYLLNIRLPVDTNLKMNLNIGHMYDLQLTAIFQNGGFTKFGFL